MRSALRASAARVGRRVTAYPNGFVERLARAAVERTDVDAGAKRGIIDQDAKASAEQDDVARDLSSKLADRVRRSSIIDYCQPGNRA